MAIIEYGPWDEYQLHTLTNGAEARALAKEATRYGWEQAKAVYDDESYEWSIEVRHGDKVRRFWSEEALVIAGRALRAKA